MIRECSKGLHRKMYKYVWFVVKRNIKNVVKQEEIFYERYAKLLEDIAWYEEHWPQGLL